MGESSAFLTRSFSHPSPKSAGSQEKDPILTSSVSLGRFMSETLAWDKWSVFNQNRYIEEAERYSKPGSVAAKKAYFEAHYKNLAAKKAAALLEQQCPAVVNVSSGHKVNGNDDNSTAESRKNLPQERHAEGFLTEEAEKAIGRPPFTEKNVNQQIDVESHDVQGMQEIKNVPTLGGSVAEKKSYLEAHFKKIAAEKATAVENCSLGNRSNENDDKSASKLELARESSEGTKIPKMCGENTLNTGALLSVDATQQTLSEERGMQGTQTEELEQPVEQPPFTEKDVKPLCSNQMDVDTRDEQNMKPLLENASIFEDSTSMDNNEDAFSSGKPSANDGGSNSRSSLRPNARVSRRKLDHVENSTTKKRSNQSSEKLRSTQSLEKKRLTQSLESKRSARGCSLSTEKDIKPLCNHHRDGHTRDEQKVKPLLENASSFEDSASMDKSEDVFSSNKPSANDGGSNSRSSLRPNACVSRRKLDHAENSTTKKRSNQSSEKLRSTQSLEKKRSTQSLESKRSARGRSLPTEKDIKPLCNHHRDVDTRDEQNVKPLLENASTFEDSASMDKNEDTFSSGKPSANDGGSNSRSSLRPNARVSRRKLDHTENSTTKKRSNQSLEKLRSTQSLEKKRSTQSLENKRSARGRSLSTEKDIKPLCNHDRDVETHVVDLDGKATVENPSASGASVTSVKNEDACFSRKPSSNNHESKFISSTKPNVPTCSRKLDRTDIPISKKRPTQSLEKRRPSVQALHMSMNFISGSFDASKTSSPVSKKIVDSRLHKPNVRTSALSSSRQTLLRADVGGKSHLRVSPELENGRTKTLRDQPVSGRISGTNKKSNPPLQDGKPKPVCQNKGKSTTSSRSFCLRSDERAAKRREYFEKLEQQKLSSEAEKELCKSKQKEKAKGRSSVLHQSVPSIAEAKANFHSSTISASIATQKLPTQSYFQQTKRRLASEARDNDSRPPWRFSKKTDSLAEKNPCKVTVTPMKTKSENTCPNIWLSTPKLAPKTTLFVS